MEGDKKEKSPSDNPFESLEKRIKDLETGLSGLSKEMGERRKKAELETKLRDNINMKVLEIEEEMKEIKKSIDSTPIAWGDEMIKNVRAKGFFLFNDLPLKFRANSYSRNKFLSKNHNFIPLYSFGSGFPQGLIEIKGKDDPLGKIQKIWELFIRGKINDISADDFKKDCGLSDKEVDVVVEFLYKHFKPHIKKSGRGIIRQREIR